MQDAAGFDVFEFVLGIDAAISAVFPHLMRDPVGCSGSRLGGRDDGVGVAEVWARGSGSRIALCLGGMILRGAALGLEWLWGVVLAWDGFGEVGGL
ncbi:hypothetical protein SAMN05444141_103211 [Pseudovibrio denitrificans]|uniref:Uncharacterized protein n=1 Tax=Pseudovibrio denitrificans TaxID=258256 RepID=A0A1I7AMQ0_9HYPH|nr:hypothetical protein [Pseudovibrio denitrificans]SFT76261.1 hypothetical protein SAMN05444141_103211 [Pseudovibrio denitrificans]